MIYRKTLTAASYPLPRIGPPWYTPTLRRDLLKKVQKAFGLEQNGIYDKALFDKVKGVQEQLKIPATGIVDNIFLEMIGFTPVEIDPGWPETQQPAEEHKHG